MRHLFTPYSSTRVYEGSCEKQTTRKMVRSEQVSGGVNFYLFLKKIFLRHFPSGAWGICRVGHKMCSSSNKSRWLGMSWTLWFTQGSCSLYRTNLYSVFTLTLGCRPLMLIWPFWSFQTLELARTWSPMVNLWMLVELCVSFCEYLLQ